jgi:TonB family protein
MSHIIQRFKPILFLPLFALAAAGLAWGEDVKKVSQADALRAVVNRVQPDYPTHARQLKIEGLVELQVLIAEGGTVEKVDIVSGNPILTRPAVDAIRRWKFTPFTEDGKAVKAAAPISVAFKL